MWFQGLFWNFFKICSFNFFNFFLFWIFKLKQSYFNLGHWWLWADFEVSIFNHKIRITVINCNPWDKKLNHARDIFQWENQWNFFGMYKKLEFNNSIFFFNICIGIFKYLIQICLPPFLRTSILESSKPCTLVVLETSQNLFRLVINLVNYF